MVAIASLPTTDTAGRRGLVVVPSPSGGRASTAAELHPALRLVLLAVLAVGVVAGLAHLIRTPGVVGTPPAVTTTHVVAEGESLWSLAVDHAPAGEAAGYVERLVAANGSAVVVPGDVVVLPTP